jgi:hypothetical protein
MVISYPLVVGAQVIDTNRPGFTFSPGTVPSGHWQLESGITYDRPDADNKSYAAPIAELRYGLGPAVEIFASGLSWNRSDSNAGQVSGFGDVALGAKFALSRPGAKAATALLLQLSVPTGDDEFSSGSWDPSGAFIWAYDGAITLAGTAKLSSSGGRLQLDNSLKLPVSLSGPHSVFVEWEMNLPEGGSDQHWLNGGYQRLLGDRIQVDLNFGLGVTNSDDGKYRLGLGFSWLY